MSSNQRSALLDLVRLFLRLGTVAFGGPAAHIAMFREEVVVRRKWLTEQRFLDLMGATNLIPGPNSTEMAIHIGLERAGWRGLIVAGACFILPASIIVGALAWAYVEFQTVPALGWITYGIKPVVVAIIFNALFGLGMTAFKTRWLIALGLSGLILFLAGINELAVLFGSGFLVAFIRTAGKWPLGGRGVVAFLPLLGFNAAAKALAAVPSLEQIFLSFLKLGAVIYGSGYVLLPFMNNELVERLEWLTATQLLDAIAIGQITPGPVFTTATFVGYLLAGVPGAAVATVAIFLPSFAFVGILNPLVRKIRDLDWAAGFLDGVNAAAIALMAGAVIQLRSSAIIDWPTAIIAVASLVALRMKVNATWLILGAAGFGVVVRLVFG